MNKLRVLRKKATAWLLNQLENTMDKQYGRRKRSMFSRLPSKIVEIGPGTGANFRYYSPGTKLIAIEPNSMMHPYLETNAERYRLRLQIQTGRGEEIQLEDETTEAVVGTLVLCTVENPQQVLTEVHRILKPGGRYLFLEHVAAPGGTRLRAVQDLLHVPWHRLFDGCNLNRDTDSLLRSGEFSAVDMDCFLLDSPFMPVAPHIFGQAVK